MKEKQKSIYITSFSASPENQSESICYLQLPALINF